MKTKTPPPAKPVREPRFDCRQPNFSEGALCMMEQATGQRLTRPVVTVKPPAAAAVDAE